MPDPQASPPRLIAGSRVVGADVRNASGEKLGVISDIMIERESGRVAYAVMRFGGFLGVGHTHHPLPWETLSYDPTSQGYVLHLDRETLEGAPTLADEGGSELQEPDWDARLRRHYGLTLP